MAIPQKIRSFALPFAMVAGFIFHNAFDRIGFLPPYLIFAMLFITSTRISIREMKITKLHWAILSVQVLGGIAIYFLLSRFNPVIAQGMMMSVFAPTAMAAVVIAGILGANVTTAATLCLFTNVSVAFIAPLLFASLGVHPELPFFESAFRVLSRVGTLLILPFLLAWLLEKVSPKAHEAVRTHQDVSYWIWLVCMTIVVGRTIKFIIDQPSGSYTTILILAGGALILCLLQFFIGRRIGTFYGDKIAGGQSLGQKNNVLAIWMAQTYLDPLSSVAPATYVIWQNTYISWQMWRKSKRRA